MYVGLTGGIASGKSMVATLFERLGAIIIDSDDLARQVVAPGTPGLQAIVEAFGDDVLSEGALDREKLGAIIFHDPAQREVLNGIVHPLVRQARARIVEGLRPDQVGMAVIPLLVETGLRDFDAVIVVDVPVEVQVERLMSRDGRTREEALARIRSQATREQRLAAADHVIDNSGDIQATRAEVQRVWEALRTHPPLSAAHE